MSTVPSRLRRVALATAITALLPATGASAGTPFTLGTTTNSNDAFSVTMDDTSGTAYVTWKSGDAELRFCKVPRGVAACQDQRTLAFTDGTNGGSRPFLVRNPDTGALMIVDSRYVPGDVRVFTSADDGATWSTYTLVSGADPGTDARRPLLLDGGFLITPTANSGRRLDRWALNGSDAATETFADLPTGAVSFLVYDVAVARATDPGLVAVANNLDNAYYWTLPDQTGADTAGNWTGPTLLGAGEKDTDIVSGGGQTYVFSRAGEVVRVRKLTGGSFGPPVSATFSGSLGRTDVSGDGGDTARVGFLSGTVRALVSTDGGASYAARTIAAEPGSFPDVAIANDGQGLAIWKTDGNVLRAADLTSVTPSSPTPTPTPSPGPGGGSTAPGGTVFVPGGPTGVPSSSSGSGNGATYTVTGPKTCVPRGGWFTVTLKFKKQKRKGNVFVKITKVDFSINGKIKKTDRKAPFRQTLTATATAAKGSTITMRARAFIKVRKTKRIPKKSIFLKIRICS